MTFGKSYLRFLMIAKNFSRKNFAQTPPFPREKLAILIKNSRKIQTLTKIFTVAVIGIPSKMRENARYSCYLVR